MIWTSVTICTRGQLCRLQVRQTPPLTQHVPKSWKAKQSRSRLRTSAQPSNPKKHVRPPNALCRSFGKGKKQETTHFLRSPYFDTFLGFPHILDSPACPLPQKTRGKQRQSGLRLALRARCSCSAARLQAELTARCCLRGDEAMPPGYLGKNCFGLSYHCQSHPLK